MFTCSLTLFSSLTLLQLSVDYVCNFIANSILFLLAITKCVAYGSRFFLLFLGN